MLRIGERDKKVIKAFVEKKPAEGYKLFAEVINGELVLSGHWMGGSRIAYWHGSHIITNDLGSKAAETVHRAIAKAANKHGRYQG